MNSRAKGKKGELELVHVLKSHGFENVRRGQQYSGSNGDADVVGIKGLHIEVKRRERTDINAWLLQSENDARPDELPCVIHRRNHEEWKTTIWLHDFLTLIRKAEELEELQRKGKENDKG